MFLTLLPTVITSIWVSTSERVTICARKVAAPQNSLLTRFAPRLTTRLTRLQHTARTEQRLDRTATSTCSLTTPQDSRGEMKVGRGGGVFVLPYHQDFCLAFEMIKTHAFLQVWWQARTTRRCVITEEEGEGLTGDRKAGGTRGEYKWPAPS